MDHHSEEEQPMSSFSECEVQKKWVTVYTHFNSLSYKRAPFSRLFLGGEQKIKWIKESSRLSKEVDSDLQDGRQKPLLFRVFFPAVHSRKTNW